MLPAYLLPPGALDGMRTFANDVMTNTVFILSGTVAYDLYGQQIVSSTVVYSGQAYVGKVQGSDVEILANLERSGVKTRHSVLFLFPFATPLDDSYQIVSDKTYYNIIWHNNETQDSVQVYSKAIAVDTSIRDEPINL